MNLERWGDIKEKIKSDFEVLDESVIKDEERFEETETIEFNGPMGKMKVQWITRPRVLDKKTNYSNRIGSRVNVDYIYSDDEVTHTFKVYQEEGESWKEINAGSFA